MIVDGIEVLVFCFGLDEIDSAIAHQNIEEPRSLPSIVLSLYRIFGFGTIHLGVTFGNAMAPSFC